MGYQTPSRENISDIRNSKVVNIIRELQDYGIEVLIVDPHADRFEVKNEYGMNLIAYNDVAGIDAIVLAVPHREYLSTNLSELKIKYNTSNPVIVDVKGVLSRSKAEKLKYLYWRL